MTVVRKTLATTTDVASVIEVIDEKVWLTDPTLSAVADPTGVTDSSAAFIAALDRAGTAIPGTGGLPVISGPPGDYKLLSNLYVPWNVGFQSDAKNGGMRFTFPTNTGAPTLAHLGADAVLGATSVQYTNLKGSQFNAASVGNPQTVHLSGDLFTYTGVTVSTSTSGTLTGVSGFRGASGAGTTNTPSIVQDYAMTFAGGGGRYTALSEGIQVVGPGPGVTLAAATATPPDMIDGLFLGTFAHVDCIVSAFRHAVSWTTDHQGIDQHFQATGSYSAIHVASPMQSMGNQLIAGDARLDGMAWTSIYVGEDNEMNVCAFGEQVVFGNSPWGIWKAGNPPSRNAIISDTVMIQPTFEGMGVGIVGSENGTAVLTGVEILGSNATFNSTWKPTMYANPVGFFRCSLNRVAIRGRQTLLLLGPPAGSTATFVTNSLNQCVFESMDNCISSSIPLCSPISGSTAVSNVTHENGRIYPTLGSIAANDVVGFRSAADGSTVETAQRTNQAIAGVAMAASQNSVVAVRNRGPATVNVAAGAPGASIPTGLPTLVRLNNAAAGKATAASSWGDTNGQVFASAFSSPDNGSTAVVQLHIPQT